MRITKQGNIFQITANINNKKFKFFVISEIEGFEIVEKLLK